MEYLRDLTAWIDIRGLQVGTGKAHRFPIEELYIPLTTGDAAREPGQVWSKAGASQRMELEDALAQCRLVIVGDPGAGKTTFLRRIAFALCKAWMQERSAEPVTDSGFLGRLTAALRLTFRRPREEPDERPFPILIRIASLAEHVEQRLKIPGRAGPITGDAPTWLADFLHARNDEFNWGLEDGFFLRKLERGGCLVMLDGLDEAPSTTERERMARLFENATRAYPKCCFVVTTRPLAYVGLSILDRFQTAHIESLEAEAVERFLQHWCAQLFPQARRPQPDI